MRNRDINDQDKCAYFTEKVHVQMNAECCAKLRILWTSILRAFWMFFLSSCS